MWLLIMLLKLLTRAPECWIHHFVLILGEDWNVAVVVMSARTSAVGEVIHYLEVEVVVGVISEQVDAVEDDVVRAN